MLQTVFATKVGMTQAWTTAGKRMAVTRCRVAANAVVGVQNPPKHSQADYQILEIGAGTKKLKNMTKPLRSRLEKGGFSQGFTQIKGIRIANNAENIPAVGSTLPWEQILHVGDVVKVQGVTKGRGFAGAMKRHGFHGGPKTHGQSDRGRAVGSIGAGTTPGRVYKGQKMPGHYGVDTQTVKGLMIVHIDPTNQEVWLSGPVPGHITSLIKIDVTGERKEVELHNMTQPVAEVTASEVVETTPEAETA
jgi:large subunit ribosomal protein L3